MVLFLGVLIAWRSKAQAQVTLLSTEAELVAVIDLCCELMFYRQILTFLGVKLEYSIIVEVDNQGEVFWRGMTVLLIEQSTSTQNTCLLGNTRKMESSK